MASVIYFGGQLLTIPVQSASSPMASKAILSIVPQVALGLTARVFAAFEGSFVGVQFSNMHETVEDYSFLLGLVMLCLSFWVWLLLGLYLDKVLPKAYGDRLPACFCCMRKYWGCGNDGADDDEIDEAELERRSTL